MSLPKFDYQEPRTLEEAAKMLALDPKGTVPLAGGTDLIVNMKHRLTQPKCIVNLKTIPQLAFVSEVKEGVKIGALTTLDELAASSVVREKYPALCQAAREVAAYALQVMGTLGGNLCQENRCRYYNQSDLWRSLRPLCYKAGGETCYIVRKTRECHSAYCGDMAPILIALDSQVTAIGPYEQRSFPLRKLYTLNGKRPLSLKKGEILKEVLVPPPSGESIYLKYRNRDSLEFPMISLATHLDLKTNGRINRAKVVFSGVDCGPVEAREVEKALNGASLDKGTIERVSNQVAKGISPMRTSLASPAYKKKMAGILLRQALVQLMPR